MADRLYLQNLLEEILGSSNVYFQPPASIKMKYPAIVYFRSDIRNTFANNHVYKQDNAYDITTIDVDPDSEIPMKISRLPRCRFNRFYTADNLNHNNFTIYI